MSIIFVLLIRIELFMYVDILLFPNYDSFDDQC